jgi:predicted nucleic acid-binding protein
VIAEHGSDLVHDLWSGAHRGASSVLAYAEGREEVVAIGVDEQLTRAAGALASEFALRGYDAVHLATALSIAEHHVALVTWDHDLCSAAAEAGLIVLGG